MRLYPKIWHWEAAGPCRCVEELNFVCSFLFSKYWFLFAQGRSGHLTVMLKDPVHVSAVTIDHVSRYRMRVVISHIRSGH